MKAYSEYSAEELAMERLFIRWVLHPDDPPIRKFWMGWIEKYPHMGETVREARALIQKASDWNLEEVNAQEAGSLWSRIRTTIDSLPEMDNLEPASKPVDTTWYLLRWSTGVVVTVVLVVLWFFWKPGTFPVQSRETGIVKSDSARTRADQDSVSKRIPFNN